MVHKQDILLHINETLTDQNKEALLHCMTVRYGITRSDIDLNKPHLMFISYDAEQYSPHDLIKFAQSCGVHAQLIDL
ncbi:MAG: hypothetical protein OQK73_05615 [Gammaproteobacteria bacterium]|nr:hypothetical protein [Gammaproteobacteria bacterium]